MTDYTIDRNFSKVKSVAGSHLSFVKEDDEGKLTLDASHEVKCTVSGDELLVEGRPGINVSTGGFWSNIFGWGGSATGASVSVSDGSVNISGGSGKVTINGRTIDLDNLPAEDGKTSSKTEQDKKYSKKWNFQNRSKINRVSHQGSGDIKFSHASFLCNRNFTAHLAGSGAFYLPFGSYESVTARLSGSGAFHMAGSPIGKLYADLSGSGKISDFYARTSAMLNLSGSGMIYGRAMRGCDVDKNKSGSGMINVQKD